MSAIDWVGILGSMTTVTAFVAFVGIVLWAYSARRKPAFEAAANAPFALPDEDVRATDSADRGRQ
jgi:cytochrome c oxidase cbb3-type subunit 4